MTKSYVINYKFKHYNLTTFGTIFLIMKGIYSINLNIFHTALTDIGNNFTINFFNGFYTIMIIMIMRNKNNISLYNRCRYTYTFAIMWISNYCFIISYFKA